MGLIGGLFLRSPIGSGLKVRMGPRAFSTAVLILSVIWTNLIVKPVPNGAPPWRRHAGGVRDATQQGILGSLWDLHIDKSTF